MSRQLKMIMVLNFDKITYNNYKCQRVECNFYWFYINININVWFWLKKILVQILLLRGNINTFVTFIKNLFHQHNTIINKIWDKVYLSDSNI